jgi:MFS family permease
MVMPARTANAFRLALFWLGVQAVWGALLGISLQSRTIELSSGNALLAYGRLATAGALVAAITQVVVGFWSDARRERDSRRIEFYGFGALGGAAALIFFYDARTLAGLTVAFIALQAALNVAIGPYQAIIPDFVERSRTGGASSWMAALQGAGNAIGALAASFILNVRLLSSSLAALLLATCAVTVAHARRLPLQRAPDEKSGSPRITRAFVDLFISRALIYVGFYTLLGYLLFYVRGVLSVANLADARRETGILIVAFTLLGAVGAALAARPSDRLDKRLVASAGAAAFILALAFFIGSHGTLGVVVATLLAGVGWGVFLVADWAIACRVLPANAMAASMGVWNLAVVLPQIIAPALTTFVLTRLGLGAGPAGPRVAFSLALGETLLGIAWLWRLSRCAIGE